MLERFFEKEIFLSSIEMHSQTLGSAGTVNKVVSIMIDVDSC